MFLLAHRFGNLSWRQFHLASAMEVIIQFAIGSISVGFFAPFCVRKLLSSVNNLNLWPRYGALFGALAGFLTSILLGVIGIVRIDDIQSSLRLLFTYLPIGVVISSIPAALIGALAGMAVALFFRRFSKCFGSGRTE
jgi:hypothetical protein